MSMLLCDNCEGLIDTDEHPEAYDERADKWWCWSCYPDYESNEPVAVQRYLNWSNGR